MEEKHKIHQPKTTGMERKTVVITGASSGIGKAAAIEFARRNYQVVAVARNGKALDELALLCEPLSGKVFIQAIDVTDHEGITRVVHNATEWFGKIDVWINNAALTIFGRLDELPQNALERVINTNIMGYIHGARAVIPHFRERGKGVLINVSSIVGKTGQPFTIPYTISKAAIISLSECLRMELYDSPGIHVCTVLPPSVDTPLFQHGANFSGRGIKPMDPVYRADKVVKALLRLVDFPRREVFIGGMAKASSAAHKLAPAVMEKIMANKVPQDHFQDRASALSQGNLFEPDTEWTTVSGGWFRPEDHMTGMGKVAMGLGAVAVGLSAIGWMYNR